MSELNVETKGITVLNDEKVIIKISLNNGGFWEKEYNKNDIMEKVINDFKDDNNEDIPEEYMNDWKQKNESLKMDDQIKTLLVNEINIISIGQSIKAKPLELGEEVMPDMIGKPFNDPFELFVFYKNDKMLRIQKFKKETIEENELDDYGSSSAYCNGNDYLFISGGEGKNSNIVKNFWKINLENLSVNKIENIPGKKNHSMIYISDYYVFIIGGNDLKTFYCNTDSEEICEWADLNKQRIEPSLALINNNLYCFDNVYSKNGNEDFTLERTDITSENSKWIHIKPCIDSFQENPKMNQKFFGIVKSQDNKEIIFLGGNMDGDENEEKYNYKYNPNTYKIEISDIPFVEYTFKEKTFLPYKTNVDYILPDFNRHHPELLFFQKNKNKLSVVKYEPNQVNKLRSIPKPMINNKYNFNMPSLSINKDEAVVENVNKKENDNQTDKESNKEKDKISNNENDKFSKQDRKSSKEIDKKSNILSNVYSKNDSGSNNIKYQENDKNNEEENSKKNIEISKQEMQNPENSDIKKSEDNKSINKDDFQPPAITAKDPDNKISIHLSKNINISQNSNGEKEKIEENINKDKSVDSKSSPKNSQISNNQNQINSEFNLNKLSTKKTILNTDNENNEKNISGEIVVENQENNNDKNVNRYPSLDEDKKDKRSDDIEVSIHDDIPQKIVTGPNVDLKDRIINKTAKEEKDKFYMSGIIQGVNSDGIIDIQNSQIKIINDDKKNIKINGPDVKVKGPSAELKRVNGGANVKGSNTNKVNINVNGQDTNKEENIINEDINNFHMEGIIHGIKKETELAVNPPQFEKKNSQDLQIDDQKINGNVNYNIDGPKINEDNPKINSNKEKVGGKANLKITGPKAELQNSSDNFCLLGFIEGKGDKKNDNKINGNIPDINDKIPDENIKGKDTNGKVDFSNSGIIPGINVKGPNVNVPSGDVDFNIKEDNTNIPNANINLNKKIDGNINIKGDNTISGIVPGFKKEDSQHETNVHNPDINVKIKDEGEKSPKYDFFLNGLIPSVKGKDKDNTKGNEVNINGELGNGKMKLINNKPKKLKINNGIDGKVDINFNTDGGINPNNYDLKNIGLNYQEKDEDVKDDNKVQISLENGNNFRRKGRGLPTVGVKISNFQVSKVDTAGNLDVDNINVDNEKTANVGVNGQKIGERITE